MLHNDIVYPDPFDFKPERFMKDGQLDPAARDPAHAAFGFGRRYDFSLFANEHVPQLIVPAGYVQGVIWHSQRSGLLSPPLLLLLILQRQ
jgi:hypothetical protein